MSRAVVYLTIDDAGHFTPEQRAAIVAGYAPHEREARSHGVPLLGSGRVFPVADEAITVAPFAIPDWFHCIGGMDFGWDHPYAAVKLAHDRDDDIVYVCQAYRQREATPVIHAAATKAWGDKMPWAWPHDGWQHDKQSGEELASAYRKAGLAMLPEHATHGAGGFGVEAGILEMLERMQTGRLKAFSHLGDWFQEFRLYHRKDGRIVKEGDDLMSATRIAMMMLRHAKQNIRKWKAPPQRGPYRTDYPVFRRR